MLSTAAWFTAVTAMQLALCCANPRAIFNSELQLVLAYQTHTRKSQTDARAAAVELAYENASCSARERVCTSAE